jgi:ferredoxin
MRYEVRGGCVFCGTCGMVCPVDAVEVVDGKTRIDQEKCIRCGECIDNCYTQAIVRIDDEEPQRSDD